MKRNYTALALALCLCLAGCGKKSEAPKKEEKPAKVAATTKKDEAYEPEKDKAAAEKALFESDNEDKRNAALEDASDYIALVELSTNANGQMELEFIKNYKGMLSTVELPVPKGMTPNQEYIIFYRDGADGVVGPVHPTYGYYAVDGSDDPLLRHMERTYGDLDEDEEDTSSVKSKKDADAYDEDSYGSSKDSSSEKSSSSSKKSSSKTSSSKESTKSTSDTKKSSSQSKSSSDSKKSSKKSSSDEQ
ncbi:hypothetical protein [Aedoeadaptatus pacaensis]|uniref:hypothetical protein n=1 Tax=Aedoeadaptatus pacaensis TaxID=1776390 RepID=UPI00083821DD|nr:hypothetical protein [Peptoniphilus pacaensis]